MGDILKMARVQVFVIVIFVFFKFVRRNSLDVQTPAFFKIFLYSFPNFCEALIGILTLAMLGLYANRKLKIRNIFVYLLSLVLAAIYVISQEINLHSLGGHNTYDPYDIVFSLIGLGIGFTLLLSMKPSIQA